MYTHDHICIKGPQNPGSFHRQKPPCLERGTVFLHRLLLPLVVAFSRLRVADLAVDGFLVALNVYTDVEN